MKTVAYVCPVLLATQALLSGQPAAPHYFVTTPNGYVTPISQPIALKQPRVAQITAYDSNGNAYYGNPQHVWRLNADGTQALIAGSYSSTAQFVEGQPAVDTVFQGVTDFRFDSLGDLYLADNVGNKIYKVTPDGTIHTFAGTGSPPSAALPVVGPGVLATSVPLSPSSIAIDSNNNVYAEVYVAMTTACFAVVSFPSDGSSANLVATGNSGTCTAGLVKMAVASSNLFLVGSAGNFEMSLPGSTTQQATLLPSTLAIGNIAGAPNGYLYDLISSGLTEVNPQTLAVEPVPNSSALNGDAGVLAVNSLTGDVAVAGGRLRILTALTGNAQLVCCNAPLFSGDGGPAALAVMNPGPLVADAAGNLYLGDVNNNRIRKIAPNGVINTIAGTGVAGSTGDNKLAIQAEITLQSSGLALDGAGNLYFINPLNSGSSIRKVDRNGIITTVAGGGTSTKLSNGVSGTSVSIEPLFVAADSAGNVYFDGNRLLYQLSAAGTISLLAGTGTLGVVPPGTAAVGAGIGAITAIAVDHGGAVYIGDRGHQVIWKLDAQGNVDIVAGMTVLSNLGSKFATPAGLATSVDIYDPYYILFDAQGNLYFSAYNPGAGPDEIVRVDTSGNLSVVGGEGSLSGSAADGLDANEASLGLGSLAIDASGNIYVSDGTNIRELSPFNPANPPPFVSQGGVVGAGGSLPAVQAVSAGGEVSIFGGNFVPAANAHTLGAGDLVGGNIPTSLAGVCASFGGTPAAMLGVYPNQLNVQVGALPPGGVTVQVTTNCGTPQAVNSTFTGVMVQTASPEFYSFAPDPIGGRNPIAAVNAVSGAFIGPPGLLAGVTFVAAKAGDIVQAYATGFGATTPAFGLGVIPGAAGNLNAPYSLTLGGVTIPPANIAYAGISPCCAGFYQLDFTMPSGIPSGAQPLIITIGGVPSPPEAYIQVSQ